MSDEHSHEEKPKRFDISKQGVEITDEDRAAANERLRDQFKETTESSAIMKDALRGISGVSALQEAMGSVNSMQDAINASGINIMQDQVRDAMSGLPTSGMQDHMPTLSGAGVLDNLNVEHMATEEARKAAFGGLPEGYMDHLMGAQTAASRLMEEMRENHRLMFQHVDMFADMHRSIEAVTSLDLNSVLIPRMDGFYDALGINRIGSALAAADAASVLGFNPAFNDDILSVTSLANEQVSALGIAQEAASAALRLGIPERLEEMLARSIAAQEALVDEYRETAKDAKVEAAFHRRNATISMIINILMLLLALALQIEERMTDKDEAVRASTEAVRELQQSFDGMAVQMKRMNDIQESASEEEQAADAAIADLLREIADNLADEQSSVTTIVEQADGSGGRPPSED